MTVRLAILGAAAGALIAAGWWITATYQRAERLEAALAGEREAARWAREARAVAIDEAARARAETAAIAAIIEELKDDPEAATRAPDLLLRADCALGLRRADDCPAGGD